MKKISLFFITFLFLATGYLLLATNTFAAGDLDITWDGVPDGDPIFTVNNMLPGDEEEKEITVENTSSTFTHIVAIKGIKTSETKEFADILDIEIADNSSFLYGGSGDPKKLEDFFAESIPENDIILFSLSPAETKSFRVKVKFPWLAGNEYQGAEVIFNLILGVIKTDHLVINEVLYDVDSGHGFDCPKDRGINAVISGNGSGSTNIINFNFSNTCVVVQKNYSTIYNSISTFSNTGFNSLFGNLGGSFIQTGASSIFVGLFNKININIAQNTCCCSGDSQQNDEWVEIYNPTEEAVNLQNWKLRDNSGNDVTIGVNVELGPGEFALISKSLTTWNFWNEDPGAKKIALGSDIGDGLDNAGDHLYLINPSGEFVDFTAWGTDTEDWNPAVAGVVEGHSIERFSPGFDTDFPSDWVDRFPPTPGL